MSALRRRVLAALALAPTLAAALAQRASAQSAPVRGGTLIYLEQQTYTNLYPPAGGFYPNGGVLNQITDKLTYQNPQTLEIEPWIAESWTVNADATEYVFKLRPGVTFSDGTALDAAAVARNYDTYGLGNRELRQPVSEVITNYLRSEVIDPLTVRFLFHRPSPGFLQGTSVIGSGLVSPATLALPFDQLGDATKIIGSGPFVVARQVLGRELVLNARQGYAWGPAKHPHQGRALLDTIRIIVTAEDSVRIGALLSGQPREAPRARRRRAALHPRPGLRDPALRGAPGVRRRGARARLRLRGRGAAELLRYLARGPMSRHLAQRLGQALLVLLAAFTVAFVLLQALPGDAVLIKFLDSAMGLTADQIAELRIAYGADVSIWEQYLHTLGNFLTGQFGYSIRSGVPVASLLAANVPSTLLLAGLAFVAASLLAAVLAILSQLGVAWVRVFARSMPPFFVSVPVFWLGIMMIQVFSFQLGLVSVIAPEPGEELILPVITLAVPISAPLAQVLIRNVDAVLSEPFVTVARAKGATHAWVLWKHVVRNALPPTLTMAGVLFGELLGGAVVTEAVFGLGGLGGMTQQAVANQDVAVLQAVVVLSAAAFVTISLAVDLLLPLIDPRLAARPAGAS